MPAINVHNLQLYCDNRGIPWVPYVNEGIRKGDWRKALPGEHVDGEFPTEFLGKSQTDCERKARSIGWRFHKDGRTFCPRCVKGKINSSGGKVST